MDQLVASRNVSIEDAIRQYFAAQYSYDEILWSLRQHQGYIISKRQLHRKLRRLHLFRRKNKTAFNIVVSAIQRRIDGPGRCFGYRTMHQNLRQDGIVVDRETVRMTLKVIDPAGVQRRSRRRLTRRTYVSRGPSYLWHIDGYDKLKPYGFAIHGAIDGYSRRILWLNVCETNNDPKVMASFFLQQVKASQRTARCIRSDYGTENYIICGLQRYFRRNGVDSMAGHKSFLFGPSTANQRIEAWWSILRRGNSDFWINAFKDIVDEGLLKLDRDNHKQCMRFCFMGLLQCELDQVKELWNNHRIRMVRNSETPPGRPNVLYFSPQLSGGIDHSHPVSVGDLRLAGPHVRAPSVLPCSLSEATHYLGIMQQNGLDLPKTFREAKTLLDLLLQSA